MPQRFPHARLAMLATACALTFPAAPALAEASLAVPRPTPPYYLPAPPGTAAPDAPAIAPAVSATVSMEEDPAAVAAQWKTGRALHVWSAEPDNAAVRDWVARLWAAMPAASRPAAPYAVGRDDALERGKLRIEREKE